MWKCCVPNCRSGYAENKEVGLELQKISIFPFPQDVEMRRKWVRAIPRDNWNPVMNSGVCQLHFISEDCQEDGEGSNGRRKRKKGTLKLGKLEDDAVPHIS